MWSCCGLFGRKRGRQKEDAAAGPSERTPLISDVQDDADGLPFVPQIQPRALDDKALQEYHARLDRIIAEAAEKFISVNDAPLRGYRKARSARTASSSSGNKSLEKASSRKPKLAVDEPSGRDTIWRAEAPHHAHGGAGGSVYSLQKVAPKNGKGKAKDESTTLDNTPEEDEDRFGTVATYKTAQAGQPDGSDSNGDADSEDDDTPESGQATPTTLDRSLTEDSEEGGLDATIGKKGSRPGSGRRPVQDIWPSAKSSRKQQHSRAETELHKTLAMPDAEFAKLLTQ